MFNIHWIPQHFDATKDKAFFQNIKPRFIKVVWDGTPPYIDVVRDLGAGYVYRDYLMSENWHDRNLTSETRARQIGLEHAAYLKPAYDALRAGGIPANKVWFEGMNEPHLWDEGERPVLSAAYYRAFTEGVHKYGARAVVANFGVGWPGNSNNGGGQAGVKDSLPLWDFWKPVVEVMITDPAYPDYIGLHEYWGFNGPLENWKWWGGRFSHCPYQAPILLTECGIDGGVVGQWNKGWGSLPGKTRDEKAARYVAELWWYFAECAKDKRIQGCFPFSYDGEKSDWGDFNLKDSTFMQQASINIATVGIPAPQVWAPGGVTPPTPAEPAKGIDVSVYQDKDVRWTELASNGYSFAFIRLSTGFSLDAHAWRHLNQSEGKGLLRGVYHYLSASQGGRQQARFFWALWNDLDLELPAVVDVEGAQVKGAEVRAFVERWKELTDKPLMIYTSKSAWERICGKGAAWAKDCPLWVAHYDVAKPALPDIWSRYEFWQTGVHSGPGYDKPIDRDVFNGTVAELRAKYGGGVIPPVEPPVVPPTPDPEPVSDYILVTNQTPGGMYVIGDFPKVGTNLVLSDAWGNSQWVTAGSKPEFGKGGFLFNVFTPSLYKLDSPDGSWHVRVDAGLTTWLSWTKR